MSARARIGEAAAPLVALSMRGERYECPLCGGRFRRLRSFGRVRRENALCPRCGSLERTRALWLFMSNELPLEAGTRILHVAPERGLRSRLEAEPGLDYVTGDLLRRDVDVQLDITSLPFDDDSFDVVLCSHVLEHVPDDRAAMREMRRVLRPGGVAIVMVPVELDSERTREDPTVTDPAEREELFGQDDHVRAYGRDFRERLTEAGFEVEVVDVTERFSPEEASRHALVEQTGSGEENPFRSDIHLCRA